MVMISPQIATTKPAPAARRTSRIGTTKPVGAPRRSGSVEKEYWVLAMHTGSRPCPAASQAESWALTDGSATTPSAP